MTRTDSTRAMEVFIDCEWNSYGGDLISMALLATDGTVICMTCQQSIDDLRVEKIDPQ